MKLLDILLDILICKLNILNNFRINSLYYSKNYIISSSLDLTIRIWNHIPNI